jgi:hypothetical protein
MPFINEYIPEEDYAKYDLRRICGEHNLKSRRGHMHSQSWTIDRVRDAFILPVWAHHESQYEGWAFYWKGEWMFFEMTTKKAQHNKTEDSCWSLYHIRKFKVGEDLNEKRDEIIADLRSAYSAYAGGGVFCNFKHRSATVEFIEE